MTIGHEQGIPCDNCETGEYYFRGYCGVYVCTDCGNHKGLARCYCGWSVTERDGRQELIEFGETIEEEDY